MSICVHVLEFRTQWHSYLQRRFSQLDGQPFEQRETHLWNAFFSFGCHSHQLTWSWLPSRMHFQVCKIMGFALVIGLHFFFSNSDFTGRKFTFTFTLVLRCQVKRVYLGKKCRLFTTEINVHVICTKEFWRVERRFFLCVPNHFELSLPVGVFPIGCN